MRNLNHQEILRKPVEICEPRGKFTSGKKILEGKWVVEGIEYGDGIIITLRDFDSFVSRNRR